MKNKTHKHLQFLYIVLSATLFPGIANAAYPGVSEDSIRTITPLFDPIVVEDSIPDLPVYYESTLNDEGPGNVPTMSVKSLKSLAATKVGTPKMETSVSPLGAAVWTMDFDMPPGVGGFSPKMGLAYSSHAGASHAGWGVSVTGTSSITRGMKTIYHDGTTRGVNYDTGDALFLDGRRLLLSSGTECATGAVYVPEGDPYTEVVVTSAAQPGGPLSFKVTSPDGMVSFYGGATNSRLYVTSGGGIRCCSWHVSRREDHNGNYVEYSYMRDDLTVYPETVTYGKNKHTGAGADNSVSFIYRDANEDAVRTFVIGNARGSVRKCLERVRTKTGNSIYREYILAYDPTSDVSTRKFERLTSITCKNGMGEEMPPITLEWNPLSGSAHTAETLGVSTDDPDAMVEKQDSIFLAADFSGDGLADITRISYCKHFLYKVPGREINEWHTYIYVHRSGRDENGGITYLPPLRYDLGAQVYHDDWKDLVGSNAVADIDGDGLSDLVIPCYATQPFDISYLRIRCILGKDIRDGNLSSYEFLMPLTAAEEMPPFVSGDLDGNGLDDVACLENKKSGGYYTLGISFGQSLGKRDTTSVSLSLPKSPKRMFIIDGNNDRLPDIIALYEGGYKIFYNNGGNTASSLFSDSNSSTGSSFGNKWRVEQGDFNGDGLSDFVYVGKNSDEYYLALNEGNGNFTVSLAAEYDLRDQSTGRDDKRFTLVPMDIDRDGLTDLVVSKAYFKHHGGIFPSDEFMYTEVGWLVSDGTTLSEVRRIKSKGLIDEAGGQNIMLADFDGDGWPELANNGADWSASAEAVQDGCHVHVYHATGFAPSSGKMTKATDALGATTSFAYSSTSDPDTYTQVYGGGFPLTDIHAPMALVSEMKKNEGINGTHATSYRYRGLRAHVQGKGLLGFMDTAERDNLTGVTVQEGILSMNLDHYVTSEAYSITSMGLGNDSTTVSISVQPNAASRYMTFPVARRNVDMDGNVTTTTTGYSVDAGYVTEERTEYGSPLMYRQVTYTDYVKKSNRWLPRTTTWSQKHADDPDAVSTTTFVTFSDAGNPLSVVERQGSDKPLTTLFAFDAWGNATAISRTGAGVSVYVDHVEYDNTGRFVTRRYRTPGGGDVLYSHDTWGNVLSETDASETSNPLTTTYQRDNWGDVSVMTHPRGNQETITYGWGTTDLSCYYVLREAQGKAPLKTWYDVCGREHIRWTRGTKDVESTETTLLNGRGSVQQVIRLTGNLVNAETYGYDSRGRVHWAFKTGKGPTSYSYGNRSMTALHDGQESVTTYDAWGNVVSSSDPISSVEYTYGSVGLPVSVSSGNSEIKIQYDDAGRRTRMEDPDAGTLCYSYSADGKLLSRTDGRGVTIQNAYDALGRLVASTCDTVTTTYTYGTSGNGKLRLVKRQTGSMKDEYTYDSYGNVVFSKRTFPDGVQMGHTYIYDSFGQLTGHQYPSNFTATYTYDANGCRYGIWAGDAHLWHVGEYDGRVARFHLGNAVITDSVSAAGQLLERHVRRYGQDSDLCRLAFTWNGTSGNMESRTGVRGAGLTESFTYDSLDRLTGVSQGNSATDEITYGDEGNILSRLNMGAYGYWSDKPHAVTQVENTDYLIASASQQVSYNHLGKAQLIREGEHSQRIFYGPDGNRWLQVDSVNGQVTSKTYYHGDFELRTTGNHTYKYNYLEEGILAYMCDGSDTDFFYLLTDNVGSVTHIVNGEGGTMFEAGYDAWGRQTVTKNLIGFYRGFGGHEMLPQYRLVNMDGRLYDHALGRFLSPDNHVQEPVNSQSFNRYSYCLNNPLKYTDPDGEFFIGTFINGIKDLLVNSLVKVWSQGFNAWTDSKNWHSTVMAFNIDTGWLRGNLRQIISRFTWEMPQTVYGYLAATAVNTVYGVRDVSHYGGATVTETYWGNWGAFTLGSYIMGERGIHADPKNKLFRHEYGHYLQSQSFGYFYIPLMGLPSLFDCMRSEESRDKHPHSEHPVEEDANYRADRYFNKH